MAQIPLGQKFHTLNANTPTVERGSSQADGLREIYTMQDIIDSVGGGGGGGVSSLETLTGDLNLVGAGTVTVTDNGSDTITITGSGGGGTEGQDLSLIVRSNPYAVPGDHEGTVLSLFGLASLVLGTVYRWAGGTWSPADASSPATATGLVGVATADGINPDVLVSGIIQLASVPGSAGDVLYLNTTNGTLTNDVSAFTQGEIVRVMGYNLGGSRIYFNPSPDWIELA